MYMHLEAFKGNRNLLLLLKIGSHSGAQAGLKL